MLWTLLGDMVCNLFWSLPSSLQQLIKVGTLINRIGTLVTSHANLRSWKLTEATEASQRHRKYEVDI